MTIDLKTAIATRAQEGQVKAQGNALDKVTGGIMSLAPVEQVIGAPNLPFYGMPSSQAQRSTADAAKEADGKETKQSGGIKTNFVNAKKARAALEKKFGKKAFQKLADKMGVELDDIDVDNLSLKELRLASSDPKKFLKGYQEKNDQD